MSEGKKLHDSLKGKESSLNLRDGISSFAEEARESLLKIEKVQMEENHHKSHKKHRHHGHGHGSNHDHEHRKHPNYTPPINDLLKSIEPERKHPPLRESLIGQALLMVPNPVFKKAKKKTLQPRDLYHLEHHSVKHVAEEYKHIKDKVLKGKYKLTPTEIAFKVTRWAFWFASLLYVISCVLEVGVVFFFDEFIEEFHEYNEGEEDYHGTLRAAAITFGGLLLQKGLNTIAELQLVKTQHRVIGMLRHEIIFRLSRMNYIHFEQFSPSQISNILLTDVANLEKGITIAPSMIGALLGLSGQFYLLYQMGQLSWTIAAQIALAVFILWIMRLKVKHSRELLLNLGDKASRLFEGLMGNAINTRINHTQNILGEELLEYKHHQKHHYAHYLHWSEYVSILGFLFPTMLGIVFFGIRALTNQMKELTLKETLVILVVLRVIETPFELIGEALANYPEYVAAINRVDTFIMGTKAKKKIDRKDDSLEPGEIRVEDCCFGLEKKFSKHFLETFDLSSEGETFRILDSITMNIKSGTRVGICGPPGSGKSFLLYSLLGETDLLPKEGTQQYGKMSFNGRYAFMPAEVVLMEDSIQQNILCGREYDHNRYMHIIKICDLKDEFKVILGGDKLVLKDNGANVPRLVKKRICLARLLYQDADIYFIDDIFMDSDFVFAEYVMNVIVNTWLKNKTVVVVNDRLDLCKLLDYTYVLSEGKITEEGTFKELINKFNGIFNKLLGDEKVSQQKQMLKEAEDNLLSPSDISPKEFHEKVDRMVRKFTIIKDRTLKPKTIVQFHDSGFAYPPVHSRRNVVKVFKVFFFNSGKCLPIVYFLCVIMSQVLIFACTWWITAWSFKLFKLKAVEYIYFYVGIIAATVLGLLITGSIFTKMIQKVTENFFKPMVKKLVEFNLEFYQKKKANGILSVLISDYSDIEQFLGPAIHEFIQIFMEIHVGLVIILFKTYTTGLTIILVHLLVLRVLWDYLVGQRGVDQIVVNNRSHILQFIRDMHMSIIELRNCKLVKPAMRKFEQLYDIYANSDVISYEDFYAGWFKPRINILAILYPVLVVLDGIFTLLTGHEVDFYTFGFKCTVSLNVCLALNKLLEVYRMSEFYYSELERLVDSVGNLESRNQVFHSRHAPLTHADSIQIRTKKEPNPKHLGDLLVEDLSYEYKEATHMALDSVTFEIKKGQNTALVGGSVSGKHTVLGLIAGLIDPEGLKGGCIKSDGIDVTLKLKYHLGKRIYFLNTDFLMSDLTLKANIDPQNKYNDNDVIELYHYMGLWSLLEEDLREELTLSKCGSYFRDSLTRGLSLEEHIGKYFEFVSQHSMVTDLIQGFLDRHPSLLESPMVGQTPRSGGLFSAQGIGALLGKAEDEPKQPTPQKEEGNFNAAFGAGLSGLLQKANEEPPVEEKPQEKQESGPMGNLNFLSVIAKADEQFPDSEKKDANKSLSKLHLNDDEPQTAKNSKPGEVGDDVKNLLSNLFGGTPGKPVLGGSRGNLVDEVEKFPPKEPVILTEEQRAKIKEAYYRPFDGDNHSFDGTECRLIQIGKAILMQPEILLIDSGFFNVEEIYERLYYSLIFKNLPNTTIVCVLDRFDMLENFDNVIVLQKGKVIETGNPHELLEQGVESKLYDLVEDRKRKDKVSLSKITHGNK